MQSLKQINFLRQRKTLKICKHIIDDRISAFRVNRKKVVFNLGSTHQELSLAQSCSYIETVFDDYLKYGGINQNDLVGMKVLEIGPGDNLGVALNFLAAGVKKVVCLDRIYSKRNTEQERSTYLYLRAKMEPVSRQRFDSAIKIENNSFSCNQEKLNYFYGIDVARAAQVLGEEKFDLVVSRAVLEHIFEIDKAFEVMDKYLKEGGLLLHKIDFRDHEMFSRDKFHPLEFLTIPEFFWRHMTQHSGKPNRRLKNYYEERLKALGYDFKILITHLTGRQEEFLPPKENIVLNRDFGDSDLRIIDSIRPRLAPQFRKLTDEVLLTAGIFLVAKKHL
ncbi:MAG: class I SAM-dependent methyltransferase [Candidatus Omnitrophica bacterium]|nr:class I SAM-dependent methyltransferase [Candidatus Omnitrophota bacterium]MDD5652711.1 class I SAM-dependent methyltransferase [Candidatus Omnitrophota bacterium]